MWPPLVSACLLAVASWAAPAAHASQADPALGPPLPATHSPAAKGHESPAPGPSTVLDRAVRDSVGGRWGVEAGQVVLEWGRLPEGWPGASAVGVSLLGTGSGGHWVVSARTPEGADARVRIRAGVTSLQAVAARDLPRGQVLSAQDIRLESGTRWGPPEQSIQPVEPGWVAHRSIQEGRVLRRPAVTPPLAVVSGQSVQAVWRRSGIELVLEARAVGSASRGENVFVRTAGGERLRGVVESPGRVLLDAGRGIRQ